MDRRLVFFLWFASSSVCVALTALNLWYGELNQDEGWYLYAAKLVCEGKFPFIDFAFTQGPVMPLVYAAAQPLVAVGGVAGGRLFTAVLGICAAFAAALLASRMCSRKESGSAGVIAYTLAAVNVYQSYFTTVVKTYSLCALLLLLGFLALSAAFKGRRMRVFSFLSGVLMTLSAGTRLSVASVVPIVVVGLLWRGLRQRNAAAAGIGAADGSSAGRRGPTGMAVWFVLGSAAAFCAAFGPFIALAPDNFCFWLLQYHAGRETGGLLGGLVYKAGFISRVVQAYFVAVALGVAAFLYMLFAARGGRADGNGAAASGGSNLSAGLLQGIVWASVAVVTAVHLGAPFPYDDYQAAIYPLFAAAVACACVRLPGTPRQMSWLAATILLLCVASSFSSPINQAWFLKERDRIWWRVKEKSPLRQLRETGSELRSLAGPQRRILTQDTYLAVEAGLSLPRGLELGPFSYYPEWDDKTAGRRHVTNKAMLLKLFGDYDAGVAAFSGYGLAIRSPGITELPEAEQKELWNSLTERYTPKKEIRHFGQAYTTLRILVQKESERVMPQ